ncbi:hypothetical protein ACFQMA_09215 [Halosimplex aquaticum]|uniref:SWIM-type domain-containing protein n=1 Tax=Halosimplex aquaticum TaxID=3026162 RepID=A0ABD5Y3J8_9EURY|nr:hypothetical protein [Halosimplex aquaticum]
MAHDQSVLEDLPPEKLLAATSLCVITPAIQMMDQVETLERYLEYERDHRDRPAVVRELSNRISELQTANGKSGADDEECSGTDSREMERLPGGSPRADRSRGGLDSAWLKNDSRRREERAQSQEMDVALYKQGGIYEVRSDSGGVYMVDVLEKECSCPDSVDVGGCKHYRRVRTDILAGLVPRPDGKLPETTSGKRKNELSGGGIQAI